MRAGLKYPYQDHSMLWTLRNPIDRAISALDMRNTKNAATITTALRNSKTPKKQSEIQQSTATATNPSNSTTPMENTTTTISNDESRSEKQLQSSEIISLSGSTNAVWAELFQSHCGFETAQNLTDALADTLLNSTTNNNHSQRMTIKALVSKAQVPPRSARYVQILRNDKKNSNQQLLIQVDCVGLGLDTLEGNGDKSHLFYNYAHYQHLEDLLRGNSRRSDKNSKPLPSNNAVFVLRTEHLWDDVLQTNELLETLVPKKPKQRRKRRHQRQVTMKTNATSNKNDWKSALASLQNYRETHGSESYRVRSKLSPQGRRVMCCGLANEIQIYQELLQQAVNLSHRQKMESLHAIFVDCGVSVSALRVNGGNSSGNVDRFNWKIWHSKGCPRMD